MNRLRVAIVVDPPEEGWPSMDLTAEMLLKHLNQGHSDEVEAVRVCPAYHRRFARLPGRRAASVGNNADRLLNRYLDYPRDLRRIVGRESFDVYHVADHSYSQLVHVLPAGRTVVSCHDLDTFRCLLRPDLEPRPAWFRSLTRRTLQGMQKAAIVAASSESTRAAIVEHRLVEADRLTMIHLGTHPEFMAEPDPKAEAEADRIVGPVEPGGPPMVLHVGSNIPRKRIDVLLGAFAGIRRVAPDARLIKVGGEFTPTQSAQAKELGLLDAIRILPFLAERSTLAAIYRRAALVLQPSEAEGFGLPIVEAMACGAPLLASDIAVLREIAGDAAVYRPVGDIAGWIEAAVALLDDHKRNAPTYRYRREAGLRRSSLYRWSTHVRRLVESYRKLASTPKSFG